MDLELIANYDVSEIILFLDNNPEVWDKDPDKNVHNSPNYKSLRNKEHPKLDSLVDIISIDLKKRSGGIIEQQSICLLPKGEDIREHVDEISGLKRFHVPIKTNNNVIFYCGESQVNMKVGECWEFDYKKRHKVLNNGKTDRIHLMVDIRYE